jgi:hypothetical protein
MMTRDEFFSLRDLTNTAIVELALDSKSETLLRANGRALRYLVEFAVACKSCTRPRTQERSFEYFRKKLVNVIDEFDAMEADFGFVAGVALEALLAKLEKIEKEI